MQKKRGAKVALGQTEMNMQSAIYKRKLRWVAHRGIG